MGGEGVEIGVGSGDGEVGGGAAHAASKRARTPSRGLYTSENLPVREPYVYRVFASRGQRTTDACYSVHMDPKSSTVLIIGGATGIGFALAERLVRCGSDVVICGRREDALRDAQRKVPT